MSPEEELRLRALELAVELRKKEPGITGANTLITASKFATYLREGTTR